MRRVFAWTYEYEKITTNPAKGISKFKLQPRQHYIEERDYNRFLSHVTASNYWYLPYCMELAFLCRMRLSEVLDLTDADAKPEGLLIRRRKGSKNNITAWKKPGKKQAANVIR